MKLKTIYIDDEKDLCDNFEDTFATDKISILTFTEPKSAIQAIQANPPDLIFLDYRLPGLNGDQVAQALDPTIPKYLITGDIMIETRYPFGKRISKPYKNSEILEIFELHCSE